MEDLRGALEREEHRARVHVVDGVDAELDRGDHAEVAVAAAKRPEQVELVLRVYAGLAPISSDELDRGHAVGLEAVLAGEPAHAAAQRVAGDSDVRR
jgi:hypothetical protein